MNNYRFHIGQEVRIRGTTDIAEVSRSTFKFFPLFSDLGILPGRYYEVF